MMIIKVRKSVISFFLLPLSCPERNLSWLSSIIAPFKYLKFVPSLYLSFSSILKRGVIDTVSKLSFLLFPNLVFYSVASYVVQLERTLKKNSKCLFASKTRWTLEILLIYFPCMTKPGRILNEFGFYVLKCD